jgi:tetratricopeptide (TPR) repeat protein
MRYVLLCSAWLSLALSTYALAGEVQLGEAQCGPIKTGFGPYDYTNPADVRDHLGIVEGAHFLPYVERLIKGHSSYLGGDIDYTLRAFPNHHRALSSMANLSIRDKTDKPVGANWVVLCYFERAIRFKPNDSRVRLIYALYLNRRGNKDEALVQLKKAYELRPDSANINYDLGLLYLDHKDYENAKIHAKKAYELGFPLPGLKNRLIKAGKWD